MVLQRYWFLGVMVIMALLVTVGCAKKQTVEQPPTAAAAPPPAQPRAPEAAPAQPRTVTEDALAQQMRQFESEDINFDFDRSDLTPRSREILNRKGQFLTANRNVAILIEGHCDERGTDEYNLALGER
ncbi:MAG: OmpA family protein, partial [Candidatus Tectomicrobia bacterium]|nr:OmpA family protein [Candidatus Tectomicrobia bacterium]